MKATHEVELIQITKRFGQTAAVSDIDLQIRSGEFLTLLGPSGCGKTTLLRIIAGFTFPDTGRVLLAGRDVTDVPPFKRDVTTVFQQYALFPHMNVFANVAFGLERKHMPKIEIRERVARALEMVRLEGLEKRMPGELSGGQQQRVALARALVVEPRVLLLDEPLAALDLKLRKQMQIELKNLQRRVGISFVFVTHDQEEALTMSDRVAVINGGRIEQLGIPQDIYEKPATEFVAKFIGVSNIIAATVIEAEQSEAVANVGEARVIFHNPNARPGEQVRILIRPEKIKMEPTASNGTLPGIIRSAVYLGESTQWKVEIANGQTIAVLEQNREPSRPIDNRIGEKVFLSWDASCAIVL